ncbi:MAG: hypothetical protein ABIW80_01795, partial [Lapillicoccus sp.]
MPRASGYPSDPHDPANRGNRGTPSLFDEIVRFIAVGGLATVVSFVGFNALVHGLILGATPLERRPVTAFVI